MEQENKKCRSCGSFNAYYTIGYCCILKENNGYCNRHKRVTEKGDSCDFWTCRRNKSKEKRIRLAVNALSDIYKKIAVIEQVLKEGTELYNTGEETD